MKKTNLNSCNILDLAEDTRRLWQFHISGNQPKLAGELAVPAAEPVPPKIGRPSILQRRLNVAWLPCDQVFLRVVQMPAADAKELVTMIEFQLEKLSPFPVTQIVWSIEPLPKVNDGQQTVIVVIAARDAVEAFLGKLEGRSFLADRLELREVRQLLAVPMEEDGVWIFPDAGTVRAPSVVAWSFGGRLRQLQLLALPEGPQAGVLLAGQLNKSAWAAEMEGWLAAPVRCHLVAEPEAAAAWEPGLRQWSGSPVTITPPSSKASLAELTARRAAQGEPSANLLPAEHSLRYRQQFVDRLWMTGLGAVLGAYIVAVLVYFASLYVMDWQKDRVAKELKSVSGSYTNTIKLKEKIAVLQGQLDLKFAALDAFKAIAEHLPADATLTSFTFSKGKSLDVTGNLPNDQPEALTKFSKDLREAAVEGQKIFTNVPIPTWSLAPGSGGAQQIRWTLKCDLK